MIITPLKSLKIKVQETDNDTYTDEELQNILEDNDNNVLKAAWIICLMKANTEKKIKVGPIEIENFDPDYWNNMAALYKEEYLAEQAKLNPTETGYKNHMRRADGC